MQNWYNYFLTSKNSRLINGHIKAEDLYEKILNHDGSTAFCCYFDLEFSKLKLEWDTGKLDNDGKKIYEYTLDDQRPSNEAFKCNGKTFTSYEGIARPALNCVSFDFDAEDPQDALDDVRKFVEWLDIKDIAIFFSGSKGFHVMVPFGYFPLQPNEFLPNQLKDLAKYLKQTFKTLDDSIYNYNRKFRVPFTKHDKSGLYKNTFYVEQLKEMPIEEMKQEALESLRYDFIKEINPTATREPLQIFIDAIEESKRASYVIEKEKAGNLEKPSPFEKFDGKLCIKKLLESTCTDVGRNNAALVIVNDYYRTGKPQDKCEKDLAEWAGKNGLPLSELSTIITNIYQRGANYNYGCQNEIKSLYCSGQCPIWSKLDIDKRPAVIDAPKNVSNTKSEMDIVKTALEKIFSCKWNEKLEEFENGFIVKQGEKDLFIYKDQYWQYVDEALTDKLKRKINQIAGGKLTSKRIEGAFKMLRTYVPNADRDMFTPVFNAAAFKNGTLYLLEDKEGKFYLDFKASHNALDFLTTKFDFNYTHDSSNQNEMFNEMCDRIFLDDPDKEDKINAISEMYGAALMPYFPHLFFLCGEAQSGKSTFMLILNEMLDSEEHICSVQPKDWKQFNMEPMINKLVNMVTDVNTKKPIEDDIVKQIEDRVPFTINRKGKAMVRAPLPAVHIFAGNDFMPSQDGSSHAMNRRWTIVRFNNVYRGRKMRNFAHVCFQHNPQGIVDFALNGLRRLVNNQGYFSKFDASAKELKAWALESDVVGEFVEEIKIGEVSGVFHSESGRIERRRFYEYFMEWQEAAGYKNNIVKRKDFFKALRAMGYSEAWLGKFPAFLGFALENDSVGNSETSSDKI